MQNYAFLGQFYEIALSTSWDTIYFYVIKLSPKVGKYCFYNIKWCQGKNDGTQFQLPKFQLYMYIEFLNMEFIYYEEQFWNTTTFP